MSASRTSDAPHTRRRVLRARLRSLLAEAIQVEAELDVLESSGASNEAPDLLDLRAGGAVEREYAPLKARSVIEAAKRSELVILRGKPPFVRRASLEAWLATRGKRAPTGPEVFAGSYEASARGGA